MASRRSGLSRGEFIELSALGIGAAALARGRPLLAQRFGPLAADGPPDTILAGGKVLTMDAADSMVQAVAIKGGLIQAVGTAAEIRALAGPSTGVVELAGRTVTPGLIDTHLHFQLVGLMGKYYTPFVPPEINSMAQLQAKLEAVLATIPEGQWLNGYYLLGQTIPNKNDLDPVSPHHPVWMMNQPGHIGSANTRALELAGITASTPDPQGGIIERDASGNPTGVFYNHRAMDVLRKVIPPFTLAEQRDSIFSAQRTFAAYGVTTYHDNNVRGADNVQSYFDLARQNRLWLRGLVSYTLEYPSDLAPGLALAHTSGPFMGLQGWKFLIDGQAPTAYCHEPHNGTSWDMPTWEPTSFKKTVRTLHDTGLQICVHCVGDAATDLVLDAYEEAMNANPRPDPRHRIEHAILTRAESTSRMKDLGVVLSVQPQFIRFGGDTYEGLFGTERMSRIIVTREWLDAGVPVAISSDSPTLPWLAPGAALGGAINRQTSSGTPIGPGQAMTIREALRAHTRTAAYAIRQEDTMGSLEPGKVADVIVWTKDPLTSTPQQLLNATVDLTLVGGKVVFPLGPAGSWLLPSSARVPGAESSYWVTDLTVANTGTTDAGVTIKFLGNNQDGRGGDERPYVLGAGRSVTYPDVLSLVFGITTGWGAVLVKSDSADLAVSSQTSTTAANGGTYGQSVPGAGPADLIVNGLPRSILGVRDDSAFRANLILANAGETPCDVDVTAVLEDGTVAGAKTYPLLPLGMTQIGHILTDLGVAGGATGVRLVLSTPTSNGTFAAYCVVIDNKTNDPRTLLPR